MKCLGKSLIFNIIPRNFISMEKGTSLVWRNAFYLDSLNINDLPRHFISMEEDTVLVWRSAFYLDSLNINDLTLPNSTWLYSNKA